ncbi:MAG: hypothetical protein ACKVRO_00580 [Micropepsaceae bacterium]
MPDAWAQMVVDAAGLYLAAGAAFAFIFLSFGLRRLDPTAAAGPLRFKLLIAPGVAVLWPLMMVLWAAGRGGGR